MTRFASAAGLAVLLLCAPARGAGPFDDLLQHTPTGTNTLALIDVKMPVLNGVETLRAMRAQQATAQVPVIMMTASPSAADDHAATIEQLGATLLNGKDLSVADLANVISAELLPVDPMIERAGTDLPQATGPVALIADDDVNINRLLERRLRRQGMRNRRRPWWRPRQARP